MNKAKKITAVLGAFAVAVTLGGCASAEVPDGSTNDKFENFEIAGGQTPEINNPVLPGEGEEGEGEKEGETQRPIEVVVPQAKVTSYVSVKTDGVNIRSGAGTGYSVRGSAEKSTMYALNGETDGWIKTGYKNGSAYISQKYCERVDMRASDDERIEAVIAEGTKLLGTAYVFGAVRYHDGSGKLLKNFTTGEFDCSSLMQYIFYKGAHVNLQVNTRTQIYQGKTVTKSQLKRGDLMFFTNASRKNNKGVERVGHVALYLGDNWILHTASDYAKIEQISPTRWGYFIQAQRIF